MCSVSVKKDSVSGVITTNSNYDGSASTSFGTDWVFYDQAKWSHIVMSCDGSSLNSSICLFVICNLIARWNS